MERESFVMYRSFWDAIRELPNEDIANSIKAIAEYALNGVPPDVSGVAKSIFIMAKPQIDANNKRYENGNKGAEYGKLGGRPKNPKETPKKPQENPKRTPNENVNDNENENVNDNTYNVPSLTSEDRPAYQYEDIINYLNQRAGTHFRHTSADTQKHIRARYNDGFEFGDFKTVIDKKVKEWKGTEMEKFLRPATLFGTKFEGYLNQQDGKGKQTFTTFQQNNYDFESLERRLAENGRNQKIHSSP